MDLRPIEKRLEDVLGRAKGWLPDGELADMLALVRAGEPGIALENFCTQLEEYDVVVPSEIAIELQSLASIMGMPVSPWIERAIHA